MSENIIEPGKVPSRAKPKTSKKLQYILLGMLLVIVIIVIYYVYSILSFAKNITEPTDPSSIGTEQNEVVIPVWEGTDRVNILLLGGDARNLKKDEFSRSDSMIITSIDPVTKQAQLFSILRDTYGNIPGHGKERINAAITIDGPALAMSTVSELTGLPIQYYVYTDFRGFIALIDELGGIDFNVEKRMLWKDSHDDPIFHIDLQPGMQHMDGQTALQYVRFRHDAMSDYTRTERQRNFLSTVADKLRSTTSLLKLPALLNSVEPHIRTNLGLEDMLKLARLGFDVDTKGITSVQLPPLDLLNEETIGGASVITVKDEDQLKQFVEDQINMPEPTEKVEQQ